MFKRIVKSKLAQNSIWMLALQVFSTVMPMLTLPYITRVFSKSVYGELSLALSYITYFQVIVEYGFRLSGAKKAATKSKNELSDVCGNIFFARVFLALICFTILLLIAFVTSVRKSLLICLFVLFIGVFSLVIQQNWLFQGLCEMKNITIVNVIGRLLSVVMIFVFVKRPEDIYLYCLINSLGNVLAGILGYLIVRKKYGIKIKYNGIVEILKELRSGWALFISTAMGSLFGSVGVTILGFLETTAAVGVYSAISKIPYVLNMIFYAFSQAFYPIFCEGYAKSFKTGKQLLVKYGIPTTLFFSLCGIIIIWFRESIVQIVFGEEYLSGVALLIPLTVWIVLGIMNNFLGIQTLVASGYEKEYSKAFTISIVIMLLLMISLGKAIGAMGIVIASVVSETVLMIMLMWRIFYIDKGLHQNDTTNAKPN